jgi:hypothetical protein
MTTPTEVSALRPIVRLSVGIGLAVVLVVGLLAAMAGWLMNSSTILLTYAEAGLAWCF